MWHDGTVRFETENGQVFETVPVRYTLDLVKGVRFDREVRSDLKRLRGKVVRDVKVYLHDTARNEDIAWWQTELNGAVDGSVNLE